MANQEIPRDFFKTLEGSKTFEELLHELNERGSTFNQYTNSVNVEQHGPARYSSPIPSKEQYENDLKKFLEEVMRGEMEAHYGKSKSYSALCVGGPMAGHTVSYDQPLMPGNEVSYVFTRVVRGTVEFDAWVPENAGNIEEERGKWALEHILAFYENTVGGE